MADMKLQEFLNGLKDLISQAESTDNTEAEAGNMGPGEEMPAEEMPAEEMPAEEMPTEEMPKGRMQGNTNRGASKVLAQFMSKPKPNM